MNRAILRPALAIAPLLLLVAPPVLPAATEVNEIVLRVNDRIVTSYDYNRRLADRLGALQRADLSPEERQVVLSRLGERVLGQIFEEMLMLSRADQLGISVTATEVDQAMEQMKAANGITTEEQFREGLQASGLTFEEFKDQTRSNLLLREVMSREVTPRVALEDEDLRRYYQSHTDEFRTPERLRLREVILLESSGADLEELAEHAAALREQLVAGVDMEEAVKGLEAAGLATKPIDLGWVEAGDLDRDLEAAVWGLAVGEVSQPVAARGGLHLIQLVEKQEAGLKPFSEVADAIHAKESERLFEQEMQAFMQDLEASSYIVANPPPAAAGFRRTFGERRPDPLTGLARGAAAVPLEPAVERAEPAPEEPAAAGDAQAAPAEPAGGEASSETAEESPEGAETSDATEPDEPPTAS